MPLSVKIAHKKIAIPKICFSDSANLPSVNETSPANGRWKIRQIRLPEGGTGFQRYGNPADVTGWRLGESLSKFHEAIEEGRGDDLLVLLAHVPAAVATLLPARLDLDRSEASADAVGHQDVAVWEADRGSAVIIPPPPEELAHHVVHPSAPDNVLRDTITLPWQRCSTTYSS